MFEHFLITRFNLKNPKWSVTKNNELLLTKEWMDERLDLFENFCLPSVAAQTEKNFKWLLFLDVSTAKEHQERMLEISKKHSFIQLFYIDGMPNLIGSIKNYIKENCSTPYVITSRIDNDDCISINFIKEVQNQFNQQAYLALDFISGYTLNLKPVMIGKKEHVFNPFISLIERNEHPKTVWENDHNQWKKETSILHIKNKRVWMSVIHEKNKVNEFDGYGNVLWSDIEKEFILSKKKNDEIKASILPQKEWIWLSLKNEMYVKYVLFSKSLKKKIGIYKVKK